jgi:hypothetical protein
LSAYLSRPILGKTPLAGPGVMWELAFGSWVLLQPERINTYAQAVIQTLQANEHQRGFVMEERVSKGDLAYDSSMPNPRTTKHTKNQIPPFPPTRGVLL